MSFFEDQARARAARRAYYQEALPAAVRRVAHSTEELSDKINGRGYGGPKSFPETIQQAITATRELLDTFPFPFPPNVNYTGVKAARRSSEGSNGPIEEGVIFLRAAFVSHSGVRNSIDIPVQIRAGNVIQPSVFLHDGKLAVIAPSSVEALLKEGTFYQDPRPGNVFSPPLNAAEAAHWQEVQEQLGRQPRVSPNMFHHADRQALLRAAVRGEDAFEEAQARMAAMVPEADIIDVLQKMQKNLGLLPGTLGGGEMTGRELEAARAAKGRGLCEWDNGEYKITPEGKEFIKNASRSAQLGVQPARGDMRLKVKPAYRVGDRICTTVGWDPEQAAQMSDGNLTNLVRSFILQLGNNNEWRDWGMVADVQIDGFDRKKGEAKVSFKSSEISAPQLAGPGMDERRAAKDEPVLDVAERDRSKFFGIGERVKLKKDFTSRSRGGATRVIPKGSTGTVRADVYGDGMILKVGFEDEQVALVPRDQLKKAKDASRTAAASVPAILSEIDGLRKAGYGPIDAILTVKQRYGALGEQALTLAKTKGLLDF